MIVQADSEQFQMLSLMIDDTTTGMCIYQAATAKEQRMIADELKSSNRKKTMIIDMADYAKRTDEVPRDIQQFKRLLDKAPQAQVVIVCNLQLCGLWMGDSAYIEKLNYMRDQLMECGKMWVFGMTPYFSILLSREARDLFTYIMYNCSFTAEEEKETVSYNKSKEYTGDIKLLVNRFEEYKRYIDAREESEGLDLDMAAETLWVWLSCADYLDYTAAEWVHNLADSICDILPAGKEAREQIGIYKLLSNVYLQLGEYQKTQYFAKLRQELIEKSFSPNSVEMAGMYAELAFMCLKTGDFAQAKTNSYRALRIYKKMDKEYSPETVDLWEYITQIYLLEHKYDEALAIHKKNIQIITESGNESSYRILTVYNNLGRAYEEKGELSEALRWFRKSQELGEKYHKGNAEAEILVLNNIAEIYHKMGDLEHAKHELVRARKVCVRYLGENHENAAHIYHNLAAVYADLEQWNPAEKYYQKAIAIREKIYGGTNVELANSYMNLAVLYLQQRAGDKLINAYVYIWRALKIWEKTYPENHPDLARAYEMLARLYYVKDDFKEALVWLGKARKVYVNLYGKDSQPVRENEYNMQLTQEALDKINS